MKYFIIEGKPSGEFNATSKARNDVERILKMLHIKEYYIATKYGVQKKKIMKWKQLLAYKKNAKEWEKSLKQLKSGDVVFIQYPLINTVTNLKKIINKNRQRGIVFNTIIHDMDSLRYTPKSHGKLLYNRVCKEDKYLLNGMDNVICHNDSMKKVIEGNGRKDDTITLEIFDYLYDGNIKNDCSIDKPIIIAGNLSPAKAGYLRELKNVKSASFNLYGVGLDEDCLSNNVEYKGAYKPEELLNNLSGSFGLVWDGETVEDCRGGFGEYLKYNNPHKVSMYLTAGIPVIVWEKSAMAPFVKKNNLGFAISNLNDISKVIKKMTKDEYKTMRKNCNTISKKLKRGYFLQSAIEKIEKQ